MAVSYHQSDGQEHGQTVGDGEGQGGLACCSPWGHKKSDMNVQLKNNNNYILNNCTIHLKLTQNSKSTILQFFKKTYKKIK